MTDETPEIKGSIQRELEPHLRRMRDTYRPDLKEEEEAGVRPCDPIFHDLQPHFFPALENLSLKPEDKEKHHREVGVVDLLTTQLEEEAKTLPDYILIVGRPESGKTALFADLIHLWLRDKGIIRGMLRYEALVAIQCLGIHAPKSTSEKAKLNLLEEISKHLPESCEIFGKDRVIQVLRQMKTLLLLDSVEELPGDGIDDMSFSDWNVSVIAFSDERFMQYKAHNLRYQNDENHLVLRLYGGTSENPVIPARNSSETVADLSGCVSGLLFDSYCKRLCQVHGYDYEKFMGHLKILMETLPLEIRKPFNTFVTIKVTKAKTPFSARLVSEVYNEWFTYWKQLYKTKIHTFHSDAESVMSACIDDIAKLSYEAFSIKQRKIRIERDNFPNFDEKSDFFAHVLVPNHSPRDRILTYSFRVAAHQHYFAALHVKKQIENKHKLEDLIPLDDHMWWRPILPMFLGLSRDLRFENFGEYVVKLVANGNPFDTTERFDDPIVNYMVRVLGESGLYTQINNKPHPFIQELLNTLTKTSKEQSWNIVDGNLLPEALEALCKCGHNQETQGENTTGKPQRLSFEISGLLRQTPGLRKLIVSITRLNIRISLQLESTLKGIDEDPVDEIVKALQTKGRASLGKLGGFLKDISLLDSHPATRRTYFLRLRLREHKQYEDLQKLSERSNKLTRVVLYIPNVSEMKVKKMKELPAIISHLTVFLVGVTDESLSTATGAWRAIRGTTVRKEREFLCFWYSTGKHLSVSGVIQIIDAALPARKVEVSLDQPVSDFDLDRIQEKLDAVKRQEITVKLLGSRKYPRKDLKSSS